MAGRRPLAKRPSRTRALQADGEVAEEEGQSSPPPRVLATPAKRKRPVRSRVVVVDSTETESEVPEDDISDFAEEGPGGEGTAPERRAPSPVPPVAILVRRPRCPPPVTPQAGRGWRGKDPGLTSKASSPLLWVDAFAPTCTADIAIHPKKLAQVLDALQAPGKEILVLLGPPGASKSTTLYLAAAELGIQVEEWNEPVSSGSGTAGGAEWSGEGGWSDDRSTSSAAAQFRDFLKLAARSPALQASTSTTRSGGGTNRRKLLLVQDLPYCHTTRAREELQSCFRDYLLSPRSRHPIVLVVSTREDGVHAANTRVIPGSSSRDGTGDAAFLPIPLDVRASPYYQEIKFNPVAPTYLRAALSRILRDVAPHALGSSQVEEIVELADGDVRAAVHALQFHLLGQEHGRRQPPHVSSSSSGHLASGLRARAQAERLSLFQGLGHLLYDNHITEAVRIGTPGYPECIADAVPALDTETFCLFLHQNYLALHQGPAPGSGHKGPVDEDAQLQALECLVDVTCRFSDADHLRGSWETRSRVEEMATSLFLRTLTHHLPRLSAAQPAGRGGTKRRMFTFHKPEWFACMARRREALAGQAACAQPPSLGVRRPSWSDQAYVTLIGASRQRPPSAIGGGGGPDLLRPVTGSKPAKEEEDDAIEDFD